MRCHYEVLGVALNASLDDIKKAYRKQALIWHPDKHMDNKEEANKRFLEIQDAYETLSNDQERAWYDAHREIIINGGNPDDPSEGNYLFNVYPYFSPTCFKGYGDDEKGFYSVYRDLFAKLADEDRAYYDDIKTIPTFGYAHSDYDECVGPFYAFWQSYCTPRSFVWCEKYDTREAPERNVRRAMEKENKKLRDKAKKERNEEIRKIVSIVRKRDKRVDEYKKLLEERALLAQKKSQEKREADRLKLAQQIKNYVEPEWSTIEKQLEKLDLEEEEKSRKGKALGKAAPNESNDENNDEEFEELGETEEALSESRNDANENEEFEEGEFDEDLYCVACLKSFKSEKSFVNHEKSKKHKENILLLKKQMREEDLELFFDSKKKNDEEEIEEKEGEADEDNLQASEKQKLSKKQKKKRKKNKTLMNSSDEEKSDEEKVIEVEAPSQVIEVEAPTELLNKAEEAKIVEEPIEPVKQPKTLKKKPEKKRLLRIHKKWHKNQRFVVFAMKSLKRVINFSST